MANYNVTITNEGQNFLLKAVAGYDMVIYDAKFSENDYVGQEATMTADDFGGVFKTAPASAILVDSTTIKIESGFDNDSFTEDHVLRSIGIFGEDRTWGYPPYPPILVAVCTTTTPDIIPTKIFDSASTYAYNINLSVSDTENITIVDPQAAALYTTDVIDVLTSPATNAPLSANMGRVLNENIEAIVDVYGAKNLLPYPYHDTTKTENAVTFTDNGDGTVTISGNASAHANFALHNYANRSFFLSNGTYKLGTTNYFSGMYVGVGIHNQDGTMSYYDTLSGEAQITINGSYDTPSGAYVEISINVYSGVNITTPITVKPMIRDERITDDTFVPYAKTNKQLTDNVSGVSNRNFLDNSWFTVNQRGATTATSGYGADRWKYEGGTEAVFSSNGVTLNSVLISQFFEKQLPNGVFTASALFSDGTIRKGTAIKSNDTSAVRLVDDADFRLTYESSLQRFDINTANLSSGLTVRAVKLEPGSVSTLHLDTAPDPTTELLKCQRYFYRLTNADQIYMSFADSSSAASVIFNLPVPMRTTPTFSYAGSFYLRYMGTNEPVTGIAMGGSNNERIGLSISTSGTLTIGQAGYFNASNTSSYLDFSADL